MKKLINIDIDAGKTGGITLSARDGAYSLNCYSEFIEKTHAKNGPDRIRDRIRIIRGKDLFAKIALLAASERNN